MDELETMISGDLVGAPVSQDDLALARALVNSGIAGEIEIAGDDVGEDLDDVGAEIDIIGAAPAAQVRRPAVTPRRTVTQAQLRQVVQRSAARMANQALAARGGGGSPMALERKIDGAETETAYLAIYRDGSNGGLVAGNADIDIVGEPQKPFRPEALVVDDESARDFLILDIKIGTDSLFVNSGPIPASQFTGEAILNALRTRTGQTSQQIIVRVRNRTPDPHAFYASFKGSKVK
ncbi:MAG: hypothetical protein IPG45_33645 [Deltaproteobacteria bacterium]|nr:hypothetical protein [Deltaproteobacteria bacterium]